MSTKKIKPLSVDPDQPGVVTVEESNMFQMIGIVDGYYVVKTPRGLRKVKVNMRNKKNING